MVLTPRVCGDARSATSAAEAAKLCRLRNFEKAPARSVRNTRMLAAQKLMGHDQTSFEPQANQKTFWLQVWLNQ